MGKDLGVSDLGYGAFRIWASRLWSFGFRLRILGLRV